MKRQFLLWMLTIIFLSPALSGNKVIVDKQALKLHVVCAKGDTVFTAQVCCGKNLGDKQKRGDMRTPEGTFTVTQIQNASEWQHDFGDGGGMREGAYGPWFIRLKTPPFSGIGIHGTCFPERQGTRDSEGCVRLYNHDMEKLVELVKVGDQCLILPD